MCCDPLGGDRHRRCAGCGSAPETQVRRPPELGPALTFVGASYGLLFGALGGLRSRPLQRGPRNESQQKASSLVSLYDTHGVYPAQTSDHAQHQVLCYMRSVADDEWPSMEQGKQLRGTAHA